MDVRTGTSGRLDVRRSVVLIGAGVVAAGLMAGCGGSTGASSGSSPSLVPSVSASAAASIPAASGAPASASAMAPEASAAAAPEVGICWNYPTIDGWTLEGLEPVPCDGPHTAVTIGVHPIPDGVDFSRLEAMKQADQADSAEYKAMLDKVDFTPCDEDKIQYLQIPSAALPDGTFLINRIVTEIKGDDAAGVFVCNAVLKPANAKKAEPDLDALPADLPSFATSRQAQWCYWDKKPNLRPCSTTDNKWLFPIGFHLPLPGKVPVSDSVGEAALVNECKGLLTPWAAETRRPLKANDVFWWWFYGKTSKESVSLREAWTIPGSYVWCGLASDSWKPATS